MGKGMTPKKGYNAKAYANNYERIFRKRRLSEDMPTGSRIHKDKRTKAQVQAARKEIEDYLNE